MARLRQSHYRAIVDQEFQELERERRLRYSQRPDLVEHMDPVVYSTDPAPLLETEAFLHALKFEDEDQLHPDRMGISRRPEPKSITSNPPGSLTGSYLKPKAKAGKLMEAQPFTYSRKGTGRWRQRG